MRYIIRYNPAALQIFLFFHFQAVFSKKMPYNRLALPPLLLALPLLWEILDRPLLTTVKFVIREHPPVKKTSTYEPQILKFLTHGHLVNPGYLLMYSAMGCPCVTSFYCILSTTLPARKFVPIFCSHRVDLIWRSTLFQKIQSSVFSLPNFTPLCTCVVDSSHFLQSPNNLYSFSIRNQ